MKFDTVLSRIEFYKAAARRRITSGQSGRSRVDSHADIGSAFLNPALPGGNYMGNVEANSPEVLADFAREDHSGKGAQDFALSHHADPPPPRRTVASSEGRKIVVSEVQIEFAIRKLRAEGHTQHQDTEVLLQMASDLLGIPVASIRLRQKLFLQEWVASFDRKNRKGE